MLVSHLASFLEGPRSTTQWAVLTYSGHPAWLSLIQKEDSNIPVFLTLQFPA